MSNFTPAEIAYLQSQRLGRVATVNAAGEPHVVPVAFRYNADLDVIDITGFNMGKSKKFRDAARSGVAAFVVDDVLPPWQVRGIEVRGRAEAMTSGGKEISPQVDEEFIRLFPRRIIAWGIENDPYHPSRRTVE